MAFFHAGDEKRSWMHNSCEILLRSAEAGRHSGALAAGGSKINLLHLFQFMYHMIKVASQV